ncbi:MAG: NAD-dependent epimerase/dehydratase family protein [Idiomarina sp.]
MCNRINPKRIGLTGSSGFIGRAVAERLLSDGYELLCFGRKNAVPESGFYRLDIGENFDVTNELRNVDVLIHCAARAHVMNEQATNPLETYLKYNTEATLNLARQAAVSGVSRFIYLSSVKAVGESTTNKNAYKHDSLLVPEDAYGISKANAENGLRQLAEKIEMEIIIIRPPLVYGEGVKGNFAMMLRLARMNLPLPFGSIMNRRSLVALDNLVDLIATCILHQEAGNKTFMVSDGYDVSTPELLSIMIKINGKSPRMMKFPPKILVLIAAIFGQKSIAERLLGSLVIDAEHTGATLGWKPKVSLEEALKKCIKGANK